MAQRGTLVLASSTNIAPYTGTTTAAQWAATQAQVNVAPVAAVAPVPAASTSFSGAQWTAIDAAVSKSLTGIQSGNTVGGFASLFQADLLANPGTNPDGSLFTVRDAQALSAAYTTATGEPATFRDQGGSATPFYNAWDARIHSMFGTIVAPAASAAPFVAPAAPIVAAPPVLNSATPTALAAPVTTAPIAATIPQAAALPADPVTATSIAAAIVAALAGTPTTSTTSPTQTTTPGTSATTGSATTDATTAALIAALGGQNALAGSSQGLISPASVVGTPSTGGIQAITPVAAPSTTTSNPAVMAIAVVGGLGVAAFLAYRLIKHHKKGANAHDSVKA